MKKFFGTIVALLSAVVLSGQMPANENISWRYSVEPLQGDTCAITLTATIAPGWHIYDFGPYTGGPNALEILFSEGVNPNAVTVGHLSDTDDLEYVKRIISYGCYIGLDRLYQNISDEYISKKVQSILELCKAGYEDQILLSHDALFFNGFEAEPKINPQPRFSYCFDYVLPHLPKSLSDKLMCQNPVRMLTCK